MKKVSKVFLSIFGVVILAAFFGYFYLTGSSTQVALLNIESGQVEVDQGQGFLPAVDGMKLRLNDLVKTGGDGSASVILYESAIISLNPETEIKISDLDKDNLKIEQNSGSTWNKFTGLLGISSLVIETPETVATVRGTSFEVTMNSVIVGEGMVEVDFEGTKEKVGGGMGGMIENGKFVIAELSPEERARLANAVERHIKMLREIRILELEKKRAIFEKLLNANNLTREEFEDYLKEADEGGIDLAEVEANIPIKTEIVTRIKDITEKIIEEKRIMRELRTGSSN